MKLSDFYHQHFASQHQPRMTSEVEQAQKQWNYTIRLANWLYEVNYYLSSSLLWQGSALSNCATHLLFMLEACMDEAT